jgi:hypothetical protein
MAQIESAECDVSPSVSPQCKVRRCSETAGAHILSVGCQPSQTYNKVDLGGHECHGLLHSEDH